MNVTHKEGNAYDILKFGMALLIVAIHTKGFDGPIANELIKPFQGIAVPVFFILSSMFYFISLRKKRGGGIWQHLKKFLNRLGVLYLFWFIINFVFIQHEHKYFVCDGMFDIIRLCKDILLKYTFHGSWFLSALALSILIYTLVHNKKVLSIGLFFVSFCFLFYINEIEYFPSYMKVFYEWWQQNIRQEVTLSILEALPWVGFGYYMSSEKFQELLSKIKSLNNPKTFHILLSCLFFISILCILNSNIGYKIFELPIRIMMAIFLIFVVGCYNLSPKPTYMTLRKMSVFIYLFHFVVIRLLGILGVYVLHISSWHEKIGNLGYYFLVLILCFIASACILQLQKNKRFDWLKYAY